MEYNIGKMVSKTIWMSSYIIPDKLVLTLFEVSRNLIIISYYDV